MTEAGDIVVAEGAVRVERREGGFLSGRFCEIFKFRNGLIEQLTTYQVEVSGAGDQVS